MRALRAWLRRWAEAEPSTRDVFGELLAATYGVR